MSSAETLIKDAEELVRLAELTESPNVKRILTTEAEKLKQVALNEAKSSAQKITRKAVRSDVYSAKIQNYGWDQSDKFLKIYVSISGVHNYPAENVTCDFDTKSFELQILIPEKKTNNVLSIKNLLHEIVPADSYFKVKTDMVVVFLKKSSSQHWSYITETEKKAKEPKGPKPSAKDDQDPSGGLMTLMKQMYEDGDDDMKRTIAKAWTEARDKKSPDEVL
ncbi:calcyclin-binding protein [Parasteatoda tepidariorum]|uniref:Calcyclin-binding protein n=1 Tax=Parasteatoda tepidariorum TaxID=114398 RepID=A0A2L2Y4W2_PARTP|nr:calcyclin-binding protein [Parasteatoda tepidariorum]